VLYVEDMSCT